MPKPEVMAPVVDALLRGWTAGYLSPDVLAGYGLTVTDLEDIINQCGCGNFTLGMTPYEGDTPQLDYFADERELLCLTDAEFRALLASINTTVEEHEISVRKLLAAHEAEHNRMLAEQCKTALKQWGALLRKGN